MRGATVAPGRPGRCRSLGPLRTTSKGHGVAAAIAEMRGESIEEVTALHTRELRQKRTLREKANGDCVFYERGEGCTIYSIRPRQCRTWPFWESNVRTPAAWQQTCEVCPGSGSGTLISAEEITQRMKTIRV